MLNQCVNAIDRAIPKRLKAWIKAVLPGIDRSIYRLVWMMTPDGISQVTIQNGALKGRRLFCSMKRERDYWLGQWEPVVERFLVDEIRPGFVIYDIGMHKGYFSLAAALISGPTGRVIGFEPNPGNREAARQNIELNGDLAPRITITPYAMSNMTGSEVFRGRPDSTVGGIVRDQSVEGTYEVPSTTLDDFLRSGGPLPNLMKMDIEGGEELAFQGMSHAFSVARFTILVEIHSRQAFESVSTHCDRNGYALRPLISISPSDNWPKHFVASPNTPC